MGAKAVKYGELAPSDRGVAKRSKGPEPQFKSDVSVRTDAWLLLPALHCPSFRLGVHVAGDVGSIACGEPAVVGECVKDARGLAKGSSTTR